MSWFRRLKKPADGPAPPRAEHNELDPETLARRRSRLERRIANLEYDIAMAERALRQDNRWNQRVAEINQAIDQSRSDLRELEDSVVRSTPMPLPATPVTAIDVQPDMPVTVRFSIGDVAFRYSEELDWTERGEQSVEPALHRYEGEPSSLVPADVPDERRDVLIEHLLHSVASLAVSLRDDALHRRPPPDITLADLAHPCPVCGNWRDLRERCITCQRREWQAGAVRAEMQRLLDERNRQLDEMAGQIEALPIFQRQLADARAELAKYR